MDQEKIKALLKIKCPSCQKEVLVELANYLPILLNAYTSKDIEAAKLKLLEKIEEMDITNDAKKLAIDWINNEHNVISPGDIDLLAGEILENSQKNDIIGED